jgi:hypothetical protein
VAAPSACTCARAPHLHGWAAHVLGPALLQQQAPAANPCPAPNAPRPAPRSVRQGAQVGFTWTITFPLDRRNNVPDLQAEAYLPPPAWASFSAGLLANASAPLSGSFGLSYGAFCDVADIGVADSADVVRRKLLALPGVMGEHSGALLCSRCRQCGEMCCCGWCSTAGVHSTCQGCSAARRACPLQALT